VFLKTGVEVLFPGTAILMLLSDALNSFLLFVKFCENRKKGMQAKKNFSHKALFI